MELLIAFIAGAVVAFFVARAMARPAAQQEGHDRSATARLQALTGALTTVGDASSHPRDLSANPTFREAVAILESDAVPMSVVMDYAAGANFMLSTAACAALCERPDRDAAGTLMERQFRHLSPWPIYYALQYFTRLSVRPPLGSLVLHGSPYWSEHPLVSAMLAEHFAARLELGDTPGFGDALSSDPPPDLAATESLLRKIRSPVRARPHGCADRLAAQRPRSHVSTDVRPVRRIGLRPAAAARAPEHQRAARDGRRLRAERPIPIGTRRRRTPCGKDELSDPAGDASGRTRLGSLRGRCGEPDGRTAAYFGQLEERLHRLTTELAVEKRVLWYVPDFLQLAASGTHSGQTATLLDQVLPAIASGRIVVLEREHRQRPDQRPAAAACRAERPRARAASTVERRRRRPARPRSRLPGCPRPLGIEIESGRVEYGDAPGPPLSRHRADARRGTRPPQAHGAARRGARRVPRCSARTCSRRCRN